MKDKIRNARVVAATRAIRQNLDFRGMADPLISVNEKLSYPLSALLADAAIRAADRAVKEARQSNMENSFTAADLRRSVLASAQSDIQAIKGDANGQ